MPAPASSSTDSAVCRTSRPVCTPPVAGDALLALAVRDCPPTELPWEGSRRSRCPWPTRRGHRRRPRRAAWSVPAPSPAATPGSSTCLIGAVEPRRQQQRHAGRGDRDEGRFDERLQQQPPARGPERRPNGELSPAARRAHEQQRGGVRQADDEHEGRDARQPPGHAPIDARHVGSAERRQDDASPLGRRARLRRRRGRRRIGREPGHDRRDPPVRLLIPARRLTHRGGERDPHVDVRGGMAAEARPHDARDGVVEPADVDAPSQDARIAAERRLPERVAQDRRRARAAVRSSSGCTGRPSRAFPPSTSK